MAKQEFWCQCSALKEREPRVGAGQGLCCYGAVVKWHGGGGSGQNSLLGLW